MKSSAEKMMQFAEKYNLPLALEIEDEKSQLLQTGWQTLLTNKQLKLVLDLDLYFIKFILSSINTKYFKKIRDLK